MRMLKAGTMRHVVDIMAPSEALDERGQKSTASDVYIPNVPCSIENLSGNEVALARQNFPTATMTIRMYGDPGKPVTTSHWLRHHGTDRRFEIGYVNDRDNNGIVLELLCGDAK